MKENKLDAMVLFSSLDVKERKLEIVKLNRLIDSYMGALCRDTNMDFEEKSYVSDLRDLVSLLDGYLSLM